jgi:hypothetical protein
MTSWPTRDGFNSGGGEVETSLKTAFDLAAEEGC